MALCIFMTFLSGGSSGKSFGGVCATVKNIMKEAFVLCVRGLSQLSWGIFPTSFIKPVLINHIDSC